MANVDFEHERTGPIAQCGNGTDVCQVVLVNTSPSKNARRNDNLKFKRLDPDAHLGYRVTINPAFTSGGSWSTNNPNLTIPVPGNQLPGTYDYKIFYDNDTSCIVAPLDPIIIIQPPNINPFIGFLTSNFVGILIGIVAGFALARFFFG